MRHFIIAAIGLASTAILALFLLLGNGSPKKLSISAGQKSGLYYPLAQSIVKLVRQDHPELEIEVLSGNGSAENVARLERGEAQFALAQSDTPGSSHLRTVAPLYNEFLYIVAHVDSNIRTASDLDGKRLALGPTGSGSAITARNLFDFYGCKVDDQKVLPAKIGEACDALLTGKVDAACFVVGWNPPALRNLMASGKARLVSFSSCPVGGGDEATGYALEYPFASPAVIPMGCYATDSEQRLPRRPVSTVAVQAVLMSSNAVSEDVVHMITESIFRHRSELVRLHPYAASMRESFSTDRLQHPIHNGAQRFFRRHEPGFLRNYSETMGFLLSTMIFVFGALSGVRRWNNRRKKNRIDCFYNDVEVLLDSIEANMSDGPRLLEVRASIRRLEGRAFKELVNERLPADQSFLIFQMLLRECIERVDSLLNRLPNRS